MRPIFAFLVLIAASLSLAQFKIDPQLVPIVQAKRRALIIGAGDYQHLTKLKYAKSDAQRFRDALIQGFRFTEDSIRFVSQPDSKSIFASLDSLLADPILEKGDLFVVYFSGHGIGRSNSDYLCALDSQTSDIETTGVPVKSLVDRLVKAGLRNVLVIADACRAGDESEFGSELNDLARKTNIAVLLGCEPGKKSYESPQLRSGVFTYFLLKALGDPKIRTESGGLWASRIAESVTKSAFAYTEPDYGDNAQKPWSFADPTSDVMLAKFVEAGKTPQVDAGLVSSPLKVSDELVQAISIPFDRSDYATVLEMSKQALSLDGGNDFAALYGAVATEFLGRSGEHEKMCDVMKKSSNPYFHNYGVVLSESRETPLADRLKALSAFWDSSPKDERNALLVWAKLRIFAPMAVTKTFLQVMLGSLKSSRIRTFFEGEIMVADGDLDGALKKYRVALDQKEFADMWSDDGLIILQFPLLRQLRRNPELKSVIDLALAKPNPSSLLWTSAAANLGEIGYRQEAIDLVHKRIREKGLTDEELMACARGVGIFIGDFAEDFEAQVQLRPYSWKTRAVALVARATKTKDVNATSEAFEVARRYCDDDLEVISFVYDLESTMVQDAMRNYGAPFTQFIDFFDMFRILYLNEIQHIGTDSEKWYQVGELGLEMLQGPQTMRLFQKYVRDFNASSTLGPEFYVMLFQLASSVEDDKIVKFAAENPALLEPDRSDVCVLLAAYQISKGRYAGVAETMKGVVAVSQETDIVKHAVEVILRARKGDIPSLRKFLAQSFKDTEGPLIAKGISALALCDLGHADEAMPHLKHFVEMQPVMVGSVGPRCVERYLKLVKAHGKVGEGDAAFFEVLKANQISPAIRASYFGAKPGLTNFVGTYRADDTRWTSDELFDEKNPTHKHQVNLAALGEGSIMLTIHGDGSATGKVRIKDGESFDLAGKVDDLGNLEGTAINSKRTWRMEAKMVGKEFRQTETFRKSKIGQLVLFTNENGLVNRWFIPASSGAE